MKKLPVTLQQLKDWNAKQPAGSLVGKANSVISCPCARCFEEILNKEIILVHWSFLEILETGEWWTNPSWLVYIVEEVDSGYEGWLTKEQFQQILNEVEE